ncbi:MAG: tetratricopeptide repeat protein [Candidatus Acidiferrales bacterium]
MNSALVKFLAGMLVFTCCAIATPAQTVRDSATPDRAFSKTPFDQERKGTLVVYLRSEQGEPISGTPVIKFIAMKPMAPPPGPPVQKEDSWEFGGFGVGDMYQIQVTAPGYETSRQVFTITDSASASKSIIVFLRNPNGDLAYHPPSGQFVLTPKAEREVQKGLHDLRGDNVGSAQKHLLKALQMAPENPYINYIMGVRYLMTRQLPEAKPYLEKSVSNDPKQVRALLALGTLQFEQGNYKGAIAALAPAVQLDSSQWKAHLMLAGSYLKEKDYAHSREHAEQALAMGKDKAARVELVLGEALAGLGQTEKAVTALEAFLKQYPEDPSAASVRDFVEKIKKQPGAISAGNIAAVPEASLDVVSPAPSFELPPKGNWAPVDIDAEKPFVLSGVACSLPKILQAAGDNAKQLVTNLQQFAATEEYQSVEIKRNENLERPETRKFGYLVSIDQPLPNTVHVDEVRNEGLNPEQMGGRLVDNGAPALFLVFHPYYQNDFNWSCQGLGEWKDEPTWVVRFEQRSDRLPRIASFQSREGGYSLSLKGLAWVSQSTGQVVHLETDLAKPVTSIRLQREHFVIDYQPVNFRTHKVTLWLPESVDVYFQYRGIYLHHSHRFSNFKLFWTGSTQKIGKPKEATQPQ